MIATETTSDTSLTADQAAERFQSLLTGDGNQEEEGTTQQEDTEGTAEEDAPEPEPEDEQETEEDPEEDEGAPKSFTVKVDGKEQQVPLEELVKGYQRTADYTRKTQEVAELRRTAQGELESAKAERAHYKENLERVMSMIQQAAPQEPNWMQLANENPAEYVRQQAIFQQHQLRQQAIEAERRQVAEKQEADEARAADEHREAEKVKLFEAIPEWKDKKKLAADKAAMETLATSIGYSPEDVSNIDDHRLLILLRKAALHDRMMSAKFIKPVQQAAPRTATPGIPQARNTGHARDMQRFKQSGSVQDAAKVFERFV